MTREEILALDMSDIEKRSLEIAEEVKTADSETLDALNAELDAIEERKQTIKAEAAEQRAKMAAVIEGEGKVIEESKQEERKTMDNKDQHRLGIQRDRPQSEEVLFQRESESRLRSKRRRRYRTRRRRGGYR